MSVNISPAHQHIILCTSHTTKYVPAPNKRSDRDRHSHRPSTSRPETPRSALVCPSVPQMPVTAFPCTIITVGTRFVALAGLGSWAWVLGVLHCINWRSTTGSGGGRQAGEVCWLGTTPCAGGGLISSIHAFLVFGCESCEYRCCAFAAGTVLGAR
jgi:hypothetical protein